MIKFTLVRLFQALLTLLAASFVVFALARVTGSPADTMLPMDATPAEREAMIKRLGLDLPLVQQYWLYLKERCGEILACRCAPNAQSSSWSKTGCSIP